MHLQIKVIVNFTLTFNIKWLATLVALFSKGIQNQITSHNMVDPWTTWVWTAWIHSDMYMDFFIKYVLHNPQSVESTDAEAWL